MDPPAAKGANGDISAQRKQAFSDSKARAHGDPQYADRHGYGGSARFRIGEFRDNAGYNLSRGSDH